MDARKIRTLIPALLTIVFFGLCVHFSKKADPGPWHATAIELWEKEEWHHLRAIGKNLNDVGKEDVESFYLAMLSSEQVQDFETARLFGSRLLDSRMLNWKIEKAVSKIYKPDSLRKRIALFRTRIIFAASLSLLVLIIVSWRRKEPYTTAPALISTAGLALFLL